MRSLRRGMMLVGVLLAAMVGGGWPPTAAAQVTTTTVADTVYLANGTPASGTVLVSWPAFTTATGASVPSGSTPVTIGSGGALSVALAPNSGATPIGTYYTVVYHLSDGTVSHEYWVVPASGSPVTLTAVRNTVLPTSVAMQTVSKAYVDTAIANAVSGLPMDSSGYVLKAGDTMTGPLVLPADPTSALQASDKRYVDTSVAAVAAGLNGKVAMLPSGTQVVTQPSGTQLQVNRLNGRQYATQYLTGSGNNGIGNAVGSADCASGCAVEAEQTYPGNDGYSAASLPNQGHVIDLRGGGSKETFMNPRNLVNTASATAQVNAGKVVDVASTQPVAGTPPSGPVGLQNSMGMVISHEGYAGGSNLFPQSIESTVPYFKSTYSALSLRGSYYTLGQHVLLNQATNCYAVGDCLIGSQFITSDGGMRDEADEGAHPFDLQVQEDTNVLGGTCSTGCTAGSTAVKVAVTTGTGTQGEGRYLIDLNPANVISTGTLTGGDDGTPHPWAGFNGTSFPLSVFFQTAQKATSQSNNIAPGTVTLAIATTGVPSGFATNTTAAPSGSGLACVADEIGVGGFNPSNYEMASYTVIDGTHIQLTLNKPHQINATIAMGGLCGYGLEQKVDTANGIRQVFPVVGAYAVDHLYYAGSKTPLVGRQQLTSAFANISLTITSAVRASGVVTVTTSGSFPADVNGLTMTVAGATDSSYNGSFVVTTTGANTLTYTQAGANSSTSGGTVSMVTGAYALYPMAEVLGVFDAATKSVDGLMTLAPNNVAWATGDAVEEPHFFQQRESPDTQFVGQVMPRPLLGTMGGVQFQNNVGPGVVGWKIQNSAPATNYYGSGGTHAAPDYAYQSLGVWKTTMDAQAGEQSVFNVHCNSHGCGKWNSVYNLFQLDSSVGTGADTVSYAPPTSALTFALRGTVFSFAPSGFTAGTVNATTVSATTVNATTVNGAAGLSGGAINNTVIGGTTPAAGTFSSLGVTGPNFYVSGCNNGLGTNTPAAWLTVSVGTGCNYQIFNANQARLILNSGGSGGAQAEFHFVNGGAPANSRAMRMTNSSSGVFAIATCNDGYTTCTNGLTIQPVSGTVGVPQLTGLGSAPAIANGSGAGSSPGTPTVTGSNLAGVITVVTGTSTPSGATLATVTFNGTLGTAPQGCSVMPRNANAAAAATTIYTTAPSTTSWTIGVGGAALAASTTYQWSYQCM